MSAPASGGSCKGQQSGLGKSQGSSLAIVLAITVLAVALFAIWKLTFRGKGHANTPTVAAEAAPAKPFASKGEVVWTAKDLSGQVTLTLRTTEDLQNSPAPATEVPLELVIRGEVKVWKQTQPRTVMVGVWDLGSWRESYIDLPGRYVSLPDKNSVTGQSVFQYYLAGVSAPIPPNGTPPASINDRAAVSIKPPQPAEQPAP